MAQFFVSWLYFFALLLVYEVHSVSDQTKPSSQVDPDQVWIGQILENPLSEMLDLDVVKPRRQVRGAEEEDQQSAFGQSLENDSVTVSASNLSVLNESTPEPGFRNPLYPLREGSALGWVVLVLGGLVFVLGVGGNMAVMCVVWNNYYMRSGWNCLLASVCLWDFLVLVLCLPVILLNQLSDRRILPDITCRMVPYMEVVSLGLSSFTLCVLGIDRFHAATSSHASDSSDRSCDAGRVERCKSVLLKLIVVWLTALTLASPELFLWESGPLTLVGGRLVDTCILTTSSPLTLLLPDSLHSLLLHYHQARLWWCFGCYFLLPVLFTVLCQMASRNVTPSANQKSPLRHHDDSESNQRRALERQRNGALLCVCVVYALCTGPEHVTNIALTTAHISVTPDIAFMLTLLHHFLLFLKAAVSPLLLLCLCKSLGQAFMDCCCCCCSECQPITSQGSPAHIKLKSNETSIFFDKAKDTSAILSISS
ncbi:G-protein coupled receptor 37-like 1 [Eucyclogobius newberryi]|uniref:G-protein coupled receptor 37-like 1 n=1 Tax=Eucyclogobius newberryi TaxID=166745 RepID=UPI003B5AE406